MSRIPSAGIAADTAMTMAKDAEADSIICAEDADAKRQPPGSMAFKGLLPDGARAFLAAMNRRYACKKFRSSFCLDSEIEDFLLECGRLSPSSFGLEHWRFIAVRAKGEGQKTSEDLIPRLAKACFDQEAVGTASLCVAILVRRKLAYHPDGAFVRARSERFPGGHPVFKADYEGYYGFLESEGRLEHWARSQAYIALANMMTGAAAAGIDSCAIEGYKEAEVLAILDADPNEWNVGIIAVFGKRAEPFRDRIREPLNSIASYL